jgi:hypothetical protein
MSTPPLTRTATRLRRTALVAGWTLIVLGIVHTITVILNAAQRDDATRAAFDAMDRVTVSVPGPHHTMTQLFYGFSLTMALGLATIGTLLVLMARYAERAPGLLEATLWALVIFAAAGLILAWLLLPIPPVAGLSVVLVAGLTGLIATRRPSPPAPGRPLSAGSRADDR